MKLMVTGATGFIGRALCSQVVAAREAELVGTARSPVPAGTTDFPIVTRELGPDTRWDDLLDSVDVIVHTAARVHVMQGADKLSGYRQTNVGGTLNLARQAASRGVGRFVFLSSVKVNGERTRTGQAFSADDPPAPMDAYGRSKYDAETELRCLAEDSQLEIVIIRPPLVYGPGVKANFFALMRWVYKGYPLPFAGVENARSIIALDNLVELIRTCCVHPGAANQVFMAADDQDVSTPDLVMQIAEALERPARLVSVPRKLLLGLATIAGKREQLIKLLDNLQIDTRKTRERLGWTPTADRDTVLQATAQHFLEGMQ